MPLETVNVVSKPEVYKQPSLSSPVDLAGATELNKPPLGPLPTQTTTQIDPIASSVPSSIPGGTATDDEDRIEKESVKRAKAIIERTKDDPCQQSNELTAFKSEYLQKRYNKVLKNN